MPRASSYEGNYPFARQVLAREDPGHVLAPPETQMVRERQKYLPQFKGRYFCFNFLRS
jgi:hypothetical protein